jgi:hypothetical protein
MHYHHEVRIPLFTLLGLLLMLVKPHSTLAASAYGELGASFGKISTGDGYFGTSNSISSSNLGFCGSFNFYIPVTPSRYKVNLQLGLQNRLTLVSNPSPKLDLAMFTANMAFRVELSDRFYVGAGYGPFTLKSTNGLLNLMNNNGATSYFYEAGAIWRVVPELQISVTYSLEYGSPANGGSRSPSPASEYGLRFRFPLFPYESGSGSASDYDGFRYPFGFMK